MKLEELQVYQLSMEIAEKFWDIIIKWNYFEKDTIGKQFIKASDSMASNLSEGFGRYFYKENKLFCFYSRGSLIEKKDYLVFVNQLEIIGVKLNNYIKTIGNHKQ